ncbi:hypothetical protein FHR36_006383 [Kitasatospora paracochleata]|uniref:Uncharacterized protein n=1 Tax=Kitasatospora paracochleata TaxID=58354 RepID=A0ABT1J6Y5_9ACTN|nr:hypothetical protein [Kitasatospora paracochleata]
MRILRAVGRFTAAVLSAAVVVGVYAVVLSRGSLL